MLGHKLQLILLICLFNPFKAENFPNNLLQNLKLKNENNSSPKILIVVNGSYGEFNPMYEFATQLKNQGANLQFAIKYNGAMSFNVIGQKMYQIGADYKIFAEADTFTEEQHELMRLFFAEQYLYQNDLPRSDIDIRTFKEKNIVTQDDYWKYFFAIMDNMEDTIQASYVIQYNHYNIGSYIENVLIKNERIDLIIADFINLKAVDAAYRQKIPYVTFYDMASPILKMDSDIKLQKNFMSTNSKHGADPSFYKYSLSNSEEKNQHYSAEVIKNFIDSNNEGVLGSTDNFFCNFNFTVDVTTSEPCKNYLKTISMSFPEYWKKILDNSEYKDRASGMMEDLNDKMIWLGNRDIPYPRDTNKDPESWAPEKKNPFDSEHKPRIYFSLGTAQNYKPDIFYKVFKVLSEKNYPVEVGCGGNAGLYDLLLKYKQDNVQDNISIQNYAPQQQILAESDIYFCHGGASSTFEGLYQQVPLLMLPQNADQPINARAVELFGAGIWIHTSEDDKDLSEFEGEVRRNLESQIENWRDYKDAAKDVSEAMKQSDSYKTVAQKLLKDIKEGDSLIIKEKLPPHYNESSVYEDQ